MIQFFSNILLLSNLLESIYYFLFKTCPQRFFDHRVIYADRLILTRHNFPQN